MTHETLSPNLRELNFYGKGKAEDIKRGFAVTSLRNPRPDYDFPQMETIAANCEDDNEKIPVMIVSNVDAPLNKLPIPLLALDGFFSAQQAATEMKVYPGYEKTTQRTVLKAITFIESESFKRLNPEYQEKLVTEPIFECMKIKGLRWIFFPTMCRHLSNYGGVTDWIDFLSVNDLISTEEKSKMKNYKYRGMKDTQRLLDDHPELLQGISLDPTHPAFKPLVLGISRK